jgi:hypothetical protein
VAAGGPAIAPEPPALATDAEVLTEDSDMAVKEALPTTTAAMLASGSRLAHRQTPAGMFASRPAGNRRQRRAKAARARHRSTC